MSDYDMRGRVALVTGAAGGIGSVVADRLAAEGARVARLDLPVDVRDPSQVEGAVAGAEEELGPIDYLVNAAGVLRVGAARELSDADWRLTFDVNTTGTFHVSRAVANRMAVRRRGAIVTIASNAAATARTGMAAYAASKAATAMFTKVLGLEMAEFGVRCNVVAPGSTETEMLTALWTDGDWRRSSIDGVAEQFRVGIPLGKVAQPSDIADAVLFLLSDRAGHITMHHLTVDGGAALGH